MKRSQRRAWASVVAALVTTGCVTQAPLSVNGALGGDFSTDAWLFGLGLSCDDVFEGVSMMGNLEFGRGNQSFYNEGGLGKTARQIDNGYTVVRAGARFGYPFSISDNEHLKAYPIVAPGYYRFSSDEFDDVENLFVADIGAGLEYRFLAAELFTTANGPDVGARVRAIYRLNRDR